LFGGPFSSWQIASSPTSPASDKEAAAQWCKPIPPCPTRGAAFFVPTRVIQMAASLAWPRRDEEGSGSQKRHLIEGVIGLRRVRKFRRRSYVLFLFVESILIYTWFDWYQCLHKIAYVPKYQPHIRDLQYRSKIPTPTSNGGKAKAMPEAV
jgi:hypothetical protein